MRRNKQLNLTLEAKVFGKETTEKPKKKKEVDEKKEIWKESEIKEIPVSKNETRPRPEFEVLFNLMNASIFILVRSNLNKK